MLGSEPRRWRTATHLGLIAACAGVVVLAHQHGRSLSGSVAAGLLVGGLPWLHFVFKRPVLVDGPAFALAVLAAVACNGDPLLSLPLALLGGAVQERVPIFAALYAWHPLPLAGLIVPLVAHWVVERGEDHPGLGPENAWILQHPIAASLKFHEGLWRSPLLLAPWGVLLAGFYDPPLWVLATLAVAYAQILLATDTVRLYQWAAPAVAVHAVGVIPEEWLLIAVLAHWVNPWRGDGV